MRKKYSFVFIALTLLMFSAIVLPVIAAPVQKQHFEGWLAGGMVNPQPDDYRKTITDGGTVHVINLAGAGIVKLWFGTTMAENPITPTYVGTWTTTFKCNINTNIGGEGPVQYDMTWIFTEGSAVVGTFKGNILGTQVAPLPTDNALTGLHGILQGDGIFAGYKITIQDGGRATNQPTTYAGTVQIP